MRSFLSSQTDCVYIAPIIIHATGTEVQLFLPHFVKCCFAKNQPLDAVNDSELFTVIEL